MIMRTQKDVNYMLHGEVILIITNLNGKETLEMYDTVEWLDELTPYAYILVKRNDTETVIYPLSNVKKISKVKRPD